MLERRRATALAVFCALLLTVLGAVRVGAAVTAPADLYWLGPYFAGMRLTSEPDEHRYSTFTYGDCELPEGEGGCAPPIQIQNWSACARNPLRIDLVPYQVFPLRGGGVVSVYEGSRAEVATGDRNVVVFADRELVGAALLRIRLESQSGPEPLAAARYPMPVLRELKRVTVPAERGLRVAAIARKTELPGIEVRLRLRIAELLGPEALADVPVPTLSTREVKWLGKLAHRAIYRPALTARRQGITVAQLKKRISRVRGLAGECGETGSLPEAP